jgi:hypothetical protein
MIGEMKFDGFSTGSAEIERSDNAKKVLKLEFDLTDIV